jgi:osmotically-inducible protein OsmY
MSSSTINNSDFTSYNIANTALKCLRSSPYRVLSRVSCECRQGILFLRGRLFSPYEKRVAEKTVAAIQGVKKVVNEIEVG